MLACLLEHDTGARHALLDIAFPAAAAANNVAALAWLKAQGVDIDHAGGAALAAAVHGHARRGKVMDALSAPANLTS